MVFVLDTNKIPLQPCHPSRARQLLKKGKAAVWRNHPFTIMLKHEIVAPEEPEPQPEVRLKIDYGSKHTGLAVLRGGNVLWLGQLNHRTDIKSLLEKRSAYRRRRRSKNLRYRKPRFNNRVREEGWLPPSLQSRVDNILNFVRKLRSVCPITDISYENCKFDTQLMANPEISGVEYQQGTLTGYEVREYLLEKFGRKCCYCGCTGVPLEIEHIVPKSRGGSNKISNLCLACNPCNTKKGNMTAEELGYKDIQKKVGASLKSAAIVNATRWKVFQALTATGLEVECGTGARTKMNRIRQSLVKDHCIDACCIGASTPEVLNFKTKTVLHVTAKGRGTHSRTRSDKYGFPRLRFARKKIFFGFKTGDMVKAVVPKGKHKGVWFGRVLCRDTGYFDIKLPSEKRGGISHKYFSLVQSNDGYEYHNAVSSPYMNVGVSTA